MYNKLAFLTIFDNIQCIFPIRILREALLQSEFEGCNSIVRRALACTPVDVVDQAKALKVCARVEVLMSEVVERGELNSTSTAHAVGIQHV
jgi:trehalose-6-phosphate synthase